MSSSGIRARITNLLLAMLLTLAGGCAVLGGHISDMEIKPERVLARGYGEELPIESNGTPEGRAANDRVEMRRMEAGTSGF